MKKIISITLTLTLAFLLTACQNANVDPVAASQEFPWIIATDSPSDTVTGIFAQKFAEELEELSNGRIQVKCYENGAIGGDRELVESCMYGDVPFVVQNTAPQVNFIPKLAVFDLPMVYTNIEDVRQAVDDPEFMELINEVYSEAGLNLLAMSEQNFRVMTTNKEITSISDFSGQKIRTMENKYHIAFWKSLGANPTPMAFSEVYIGLQQGTIDAQENPYEVIVSGKIYEQQDYVVKTNHLPHLLSLIVNEEFYNKLSKEDQAIVDQAADIAREYSREQCDKRAQNCLDLIKDSGTQEIELSQDVIDEMRECASSVYDMIRSQVGDELYDAYTKYMNKGE